MGIVAVPAEEESLIRFTNVIRFAGRQYGKRQVRRTLLVFHVMVDIEAETFLGKILAQFPHRLVQHGYEFRMCVEISGNLGIVRVFELR